MAEKVESSFSSGAAALSDISKQAHEGILKGTDASRVLTYGIYVVGAAAIGQLSGIFLIKDKEQRADFLSAMHWILAFALIALLIYAAVVLVPMFLSAGQRAAAIRLHDRVAEEKRDEAAHA